MQVWYSFEAIGTVRQLMGSQGQVVDAYAFDARGNELTNPQSQVQNPFRYVGKPGYYLDTESALMLLGVRYYQVDTGRFVNLDPIRYKVNWYLYAGNNPLARIDPSGRVPVWLIGLGGGCIVQGFVSGFGSYLGGGSACEIGCSAAAGCIVGAVQGLISVLIGPHLGWEIHCLIGALSSVVSPLLSELCKDIVCKRCFKLPSLSGPCKALKGTVGPLATCLGKWLSEDWAEKVLDQLLTYLSRALGWGAKLIPALKNNILYCSKRGYINDSEKS
jgi:RHS repeat-associated protein